jgi:hypothetical protein
MRPDSSPLAGTAFRSAHSRSPVSRRRLLAGLGALGALPLAGLPQLTGPASAATARTVAAEPPDTPVGRQLTWLLDASRRLPVPAEEVRAHLSPALWESIGADGLNGMLRTAAGPGGLRLDSYRAQREPRAGSEAYALLTGVLRHHLVAVTDPSGALAAVRLTPLPRSWPEVDERLRALAPRVSFLAAEVDRAGRCVPVHGLAPEVARPMASAVKLYVLGALARAIRSGAVSWEERLALREEWRSPGGPLAELPAGTDLTVRQLTEHMIFHSDNTATDHLLARIGRRAVEKQFTRFGMADPRANVPLLATREVTLLKTVDYPRHADAYAALDAEGRRTYLAEVVAGLRLTGTSWREPRHVDTVEWFGSPADVCRALAGLRHLAGAEGLAPVGEALSSMGTRPLGLDEARWPVGWFKGGAEPGVLSRSFLAQAADGRTFTLSVMVSDPARNVSGATAVAELLALSAGALELMANGGRAGG